MRKGDHARELILQLISSSTTPQETTKIIELVQQTIPNCTRTIAFKRLVDLRGDAKINGKHIGSGKGAWIWWAKPSFKTVQKSSRKKDKIITQLLKLIDGATAPLETSEIITQTQKAIPATRAKIFKRLKDLRGDQALRGKQVGSGKGAWIWWRCNAFEE